MPVEHDPQRLYRGPVGVLLEPAVRRLRGRGLSRNRVAWKVHRAIWRTTRSNRVLIDGHDLLLDRVDSLGLASGHYEPQETRWYVEHVGRGDTVVEAGANVGYFTLLLARLVGPEGRVVSYEPDPELAAILRRNVEVNGYADVVEVREAAVAAESGTATFYRAMKSSGDHRLHTHGEGRDRETFPVRVVRLDDDLARLDPPLDRPVDLVKMDIQGAEPLALAGMAGLLREHPPRRMLVEFWPQGLVQMGNDPAAMVDTLRAAGYRVIRLDTGSELDLARALVELTPANGAWVNLVCARGDGER